MSINTQRNRGNNPCFCIKRKIEKRRKQWLEMGQENLEDLTGNDRNMQKQIILWNTLNKIHCLSKSQFRKQFLEMWPEEGLCPHVPPSASSDSRDESSVSEDESEDSIEFEFDEDSSVDSDDENLTEDFDDYSSEISPDAENFLSYLEQDFNACFGEQNYTDNGQEENKYGDGEKMEESNNSNNFTHDFILPSFDSFNEFPQAFNNDEDECNRAAEFLEQYLETL